MSLHFDDAVEFGDYCCCCCSEDDDDAALLLLLLDLKNDEDVWVMKRLSCPS